ncbi:MAG: hypothetical protein RR101_06295 [Burkholderiaceae bacterium]
MSAITQGAGVLFSLLRWAAMLVLSWHVAGCERVEPGLRIEGDCLVVEGEFWRTEYDQFERELAAHSALRCVQLQASPGGSTVAALRMGELIRSRGLRTVARGACVSACAIAFLGGDPRELGASYAGQTTFLLFHGSYDRASGQRDPVLSEAVAAWLALRTDGALPPELMAAATRAESEGAGLYVRSGSEPGVVTLCSSPPRASAAAPACRAIAGATAASLNLVRAPR